jgi:LmbE family N-acetylglucosaminyl deacetylase
MDLASPRDARCVVLSPHPDDAVLSAWHALVSEGDVRVVTVFAGIPEPGFVTALDRTRHATDAASLMRLRRHDDRAALALAGRAPAHADLLEANYLAQDVPDVRDAIEREPERYVEIVAASEIATPVEAIERAVDRWLAAEIVYAPLGVGRHPDHRDVARLGFRLARRKRAVRFYGDFPYFVRFGPPTWLGGVGRDAARADAQIEAAFAALPADPDAFERTIVELTPGQVETKTAAFRRYTTEFSLVDADFGGATTDPAQMRCEVYWTLRAPRP